MVRQYSMILIFSNLVRFLWPIKLSILESVPCALEKNVYFAAGGWDMSIKSICSNMWFISSVSLLTFCLDNLSIVDNGVLKCPTVTVLLSLSPLRPVIT